MNLKLLFFIFTLCTAFNTLAKDKSYGDVYVLEVISIYDGDTFRANLRSYPAIIGEHRLFV
jgi:micrococcal nuclease